MSVKPLTVRYNEDTDVIKLEQEGAAGVVLHGAYLCRWIEALENPDEYEDLCVYQNLGLVSTSESVKIVRYTGKCLTLIELSNTGRQKLVSVLQGFVSL